ncbi:DUF2157 domain-containing protein [Leptospira sp. 2 VSF19]|uniref:DUF2157 domain-containing protein n=1 Tax=Leptospira soteropolitanensis TaxID=2950025 RepID=A0AAW5VGF0_9LEPT|nr:DUF2157 domain-containing protein [Leptospira soteropolitanensis]MCW7493108.1 DUF2157 domain-containing protein [Leptospira soteropolitanensis]MCW7500823.1 DUF2157 domain-containing protein [Leptospira soteropolitanensis]MCW7522958.1 DUF2157 domain-containing protein [Leptospira soteropolitanensis]MCW7526935.1 DUF2157 domain-containing protein [Leptospira soteropolitanensis]MCW7530676.1 DUF2157 domain-containing protein [Leptospira soteropolitanensis]
MSLPPYGNKKLEDWIHFFESSLLVIGSALLLSGIFFLVAFHWNLFDRFTKLGIVFFLNVLFYLFTFFFRKKRLLFEIGLTILFFLTGFALLVFDQINQTGADVYDFFLAWAIFTLVLVPISRSGVVAGLWMVLIASTVYLYSVQEATGNENHLLFAAASLLFIFIGTILDWQKTEFYSEKTKSFLSALGIFFALGFLNLVHVTLFRIHSEFSSTWTYGFFQMILPLLLYGFLYLYYRWFRFRHLNLSLILFFGLGQILIKTADLFAIWAYSSAVNYLLFALSITLYSVWAVFHLNRLRRIKNTVELNP